MAETIANDRPPAARAAVSRPRPTKLATVSASALALHLDCSRAYIGKLEADGVIQRQGTASRSTRAALLISDTCDASGGNVLVRKPTLITSRSRPRCCSCASCRPGANW